MKRTYVFLSGDSRRGADTHLHGLLSGHFVSELDHADSWRHEARVPYATRRLELLPALLNSFTMDVELVLVGRSSGARVAATLAAHPAWADRIAAVVCFAYPFQEPNKPSQPERLAPLLSITVPTLIVQGRNDDYGAEELLEKYVFSPWVEMGFVDADHSMQLGRPQWRRTAKVIEDFLARRIGTAG